MQDGVAGEIRGRCGPGIRKIPVMLLAWLLAACGSGNQGATGEATLEISLGTQKQMLASQAGALDRSTLPPNVSQLLITISNLQSEKDLPTIDLLANPTAKFKVPAGVPLTVQGRALSGSADSAATEELYRGSVAVEPLTSGATGHVSLRLVPTGAITHKIVYRPEQVDTNAAGAVGDKQSGIAMFAQGNRLVGFHSYASNLLPGYDPKINSTKFFVKDLVSGELKDVNTTENGVVGNAAITFAALSRDGRLAVFASPADNLVDNDTNGVSDVFLKDLTSGALTRLSVDTNGQEFSQFSSYPTLSADGAYVTFYTDAPITNDGPGVFLLRQTVEGPSYIHVDDGWLPHISADGNWIVYRPVNGAQLWLYDRRNNNKSMLIDAPTADVNSDGVATNADPRSFAVSADGACVVADTVASYSDGDTNGISDVYLVEPQRERTTLVSTDANGSTLAGGTRYPSVSDDCRFVAFHSGGKIYIKDVSNGKLEALANSGSDATLSPDGELIVYTRSDKHLYVEANPLAGTAQADPTPVTTVANCVKFTVGDSWRYAASSSSTLDGSVLSTSDGTVEDQVSKHEGSVVTLHTTDSGTTNTPGGPSPYSSAYDQELSFTANGAALAMTGDANTYTIVTPPLPICPPPAANTTYSYETYTRKDNALQEKTTLTVTGVSRETVTVPAGQFAQVNRIDATMFYSVPDTSHAGSSINATIDFSWFIADNVGMIKNTNDTTVVATFDNTTTKSHSVDELTSYSVK